MMHALSRIVAAPLQIESSFMQYTCIIELIYSFTHVLLFASYIYIENSGKQ